MRRVRAPVGQWRCRGGRGAASGARRDPRESERSARESRDYRIELFLPSLRRTVTCLHPPPQDFSSWTPSYQLASDARRTQPNSRTVAPPAESQAADTELAKQLPPQHERLCGTGRLREGDHTEIVKQRQKAKANIKARIL